MLSPDSHVAVDRVAAAIGSHERLGVAFSGGVDSSVLLAVAVRALGPDRVLAILGVSPSLASDERIAAHEVARFIGAPIVELGTDEGSNPAYRANGPDRCFHCKDELFSRISDEVAAAHGLTAVAYGENADDVLRPDRPGSVAATNHRVLRPLADAGLTKAAVRAVARELALPCADKPAAPCLASRIPHFEEVTPEKLRQVDRAESALRALGFEDCRVRHHGDVARVELPLADLPRAVAELRSQIDSGVRAAGFRFVTLDLRGIQSGAFTLPLVAADPLTLVAADPLTLVAVEPPSLESDSLEPNSLEANSPEPTSLEPTSPEPTSPEPTSLKPTSLKPTSPEPTSLEPDSLEANSLVPSSADRRTGTHG